MNDGVADLRWESDAAGLTYQLEQSSAADAFVPRYEGPDTSSVRTGLAPGDHRFRVRAIDASGSAGPWSETFTVTVEYMGKGRLRLLLILGGIVVTATVAAILHGHLTHPGRRQQPEP